MQTDHPKHHASRRIGPSLWVDVPVDDPLSLLESALREERPARAEKPRDDVHSLREENARLRKLLAQLSQPVR